jgi:hypothetical protein
MKFAASTAVAPCHGPATEMNTTLSPYLLYNCASVGAMFWQCGHQGSMNSMRTTLPRNELKVMVLPFGPFPVTTGKVKSGAPPDWVDKLALVVVPGVGGPVCVTE